MTTRHVHINRLLGDVHGKALLMLPPCSLLKAESVISRIASSIALVEGSSVAEVKAEIIENISSLLIRHAVRAVARRQCKSASPEQAFYHIPDPDYFSRG